MAVIEKPSCALIGGGYTLMLLASRLKPGSFIITSRSRERCEAWRERGWIAAQVDVSSRDSVERLFLDFPGLSAVIDSVPPLREGSDPALGARNIALASSAAHIARIIYLSTTGVFGVRDGSIVDEDTPAAPWNPQGLARLQSEDAYRHAKVPMCALRLPAIYGPDRGILHSVRNGSYRLIASGENWTNRIHVADLATALERALVALALPEVLCVSDDLPAQARDVVSFICERDGLPTPPSISEEEALRSGAYTMLSNQRIINRRLKELLALKLRYPSFREGLYG
jgi:nucleoside-diphosphate-sugar epimerase